MTMPISTGQELIRRIAYASAKRSMPTTKQLAALINAADIETRD